MVWAETHPALQLPEHALLVAALGPLPSGQELDRLLAAWRAIAGQFPRGRLWLVDPVADRPAVQQQIQRQQLAGRVVVAGAFDQVDELLAAADLLLVPSSEGDHVTLLEAMAAGLPIVAADAADHRAVLADGQEGLLVDAADAAALSAAVVRLASKTRSWLPAVATPPEDRAVGRVLSCQDGRPARNMVPANITTPLGSRKKGT